ncbi:MAG TPA: electron transport complex subunit RsxG [Woeseiaceae bacterium]|nr:electron transport complex subunit RsxG [Woeseiaceae bacterium]
MAGGPGVWRSGLTLGILAATCTALVAITWHLTAPRIAENEQAALERSLEPTLSGVFYDNVASESLLVIPPPHELPGTEPVPVYRVYSEEAPVAAVFVVTEPGGYAGPIKLLIGIEYSGEVTGVRVLEHHETPGLGDLIEASKTNWLQQFGGTSLAAPPREEWAVRRDGGAFDQITGATITTRAVVRAVKQTLVYFESHRDFIFQAAGEEPKDQGEQPKEQAE